ncbi:reverse transcriptase domain-containing protein [Tanacetum coccineum]
MGVLQWAMPTWCHMLNSTLTGNAIVWFDDLPKETIDSYDDLKKAFLENYLQQKKCIKDPVEIHNIRQKDGESTEEFVRRYKLECRDVKGAPECMKISGFMHGITNPELMKRLHDKIPNSVDEMMRVTTVFLRGEVATSNREQKKSFPSWKQQEANQKQNFKKGGFRNQQRAERKQDRFKKEMPKAGKLSHSIKDIKQNNGKEQPKVTKKGETAGKDKAMAILMVQPWERVARQRITQSFSSNSEISFPPLGEDEGTEGPMIIEAEIGGHYVHRIGEIIWPIGQIQLLVTIGDEEHSASSLMNFVVVRSPSPYNRIIGRPLVPLECAMVSRPERTLPANEPMVEERIKVAINPEYPEQTIMIESTLTEEGRNKLCSLLQKNLEVFAWKPADMTGVPRHIVEHRLNTRKGCSLVRPKKRGQAADRNQAIQEEVGKLVEAGIMREVHYHDWLSNPVMVKKHDNSWRMCVDFKDLNKACPKDGYPLPEID